MAVQAVPVGDAEKPPGEKPGSSGNGKRRIPGQGRWAALFIAPTLVLLAVVILYPIISAIVMSLQQDAGLDPATGLFVEGGFAGLNNYTQWLLQQCAAVGGGTVPCAPGSLGAQFWSATGITFFFTIVTVALETVFGFWMALIMARAFKGRGILRGAVLVPWAIPTAVTAKLWFFIFAFNGVANNLFNTTILWTGSEWPARFAIIIADVWKTTPFMALLILAGLQMIPGDVYEAAKVDGASAWQRFVHITLPLVKPALIVAILFRVLDAMRMYDLPAILTGGANGTTTLSILVVEQIRQGFNSAAALSTITFIIIFLVAFIFIKFLGANVAADSTSGGKAKIK
ncbi:carbohydrate ABC transporter permease [Arthrobacter sp. H14]|uniref:carbohydrate ABC transporter permease n=1 Tax=Arthrobacter sp. H14 TaxID=1312959 RepID=UPI00047B46DA|nr:sugar ABC transporter permease [Arthrobacter sp. H14]